MQGSCGGQGTTWTLSGRERAPAPRESPRPNAQPWPPWLQLPPQPPAMRPGPAHPGPCSPHVFAFCGHQGPRAADAFTGRGVGALGDRGLGGHSRFLRSLGQTLESGSCQVQVCRQGAGWGSLNQGKTLNCPGTAQARVPRQNPSVGVGSARWGWLPGRETLPAPFAGPRRPGLLWALCLAGVGELPGSVFHGKTRGLLGGTEGFPFPGHDSGDPVNRARYSKGGARCPEGCLWLGAFLRMRGPTSGPETNQPRLGEKPSPGGLPPVLPSVKGDPFTDGRTGGSSQWWGRDGGVSVFSAT